MTVAPKAGPHNAVSSKQMRLVAPQLDGLESSLEGREVVQHTDHGHRLHDRSKPGPGLIDGQDFGDAEAADTLKVPEVDRLPGRRWPTRLKMLEPSSIHTGGVTAA